jgi:hypothetical protein
MDKLVRFSVGVAILTVLVFVGTRWASQVELIVTPSFIIPILLLLSSSTIIIFYFLQKIKSPDSFDFVKGFLLSIVLKLLVSIGLLVVLFFLDPTGINTNAVFFMISYLIFTSYETIVLMKRKNAE